MWVTLPTLLCFTLVTSFFADQLCCFVLPWHVYGRFDIKIQVLWAVNIDPTWSHNCSHAHCTLKRKIVWWIWDSSPEKKRFLLPSSGWTCSRTTAVVLTFIPFSKLRFSHHHDAERKCNHPCTHTNEGCFQYRGRTFTMMLALCGTV